MEEKLTISHLPKITMFLNTQDTHMKKKNTWLLKKLEHKLKRPTILNKLLLELIHGIKIELQDLHKELELV